MGVLTQRKSHLAIVTLRKGRRVLRLPFLATAQSIYHEKKKFQDTWETHLLHLTLRAKELPKSLYRPTTTVDLLNLP
jgi:hypothetical protein